MRWCLFALLMMLPLIAASQSARVARWTILPLAHPDAKLLIGIDWRRVQDSPLGPLVLRQVGKGGHPLLGLLDSIENIDRILVSSPGGQTGRSPLLVVGEGRFSLPRIRAMAKADGAVSRRYNDVELLVPPNATPFDLHFALLDGQTILFGDGSSVKAAIDRWQRADSLSERNPLFFRAVTLSTTQEIWALVDQPAESLSSLGMAESDLAAQVEHLELGVSTTDTLNASLVVQAATAEAAAALGSGLPALLQLAALNYSQQPALTQVARRVKVATDKTTVKMAFTIDNKLLDQSLNELRAAAAPPLVTETAPMNAPRQARMAAVPGTPAALDVPDPSSQSVRKVVRIVGMEDGVKEIPYEARKPGQ
ncbi:MAG: hypothetical protein IANPNBLG_03679 [Bryobacteraceae bacterium]|nr:hypothetical protein [Bryobacteraceae bacterium]